MGSNGNRRLRVGHGLWRSMAMGVACLIVLVQGAAAQKLRPECGELGNTFGPYDYRDHVGTRDYKVNKNNPLYLVEMAHFRPEMEALRHGGQGPKSEVGQEFDSTLMAFPNHHRALDAVIRLVEKKKGANLDMRYTPTCWFERAIAFRSDDAIVRMLFATYLGSQRKVNEAVEQLETAARLGKDNAFTQYNVGLGFLDLKMFDRALAQAHTAYGMGMQRQELREMRTKAGQWRDPGEASPPQSGQSSAAASK